MMQLEKQSTSGENAAKSALYLRARVVFPDHMTCIVVA